VTGVLRAPVGVLQRCLQDQSHSLTGERNWARHVDCHGTPVVRYQAVCPSWHAQLGDLQSSRDSWSVHCPLCGHQGQCLGKTVTHPGTSTNLVPDGSIHRQVSGSDTSLGAFPSTSSHTGASPSATCCR